MIQIEKQISILDKLSSTIQMEETNAKLQNPPNSDEALVMRVCGVLQQNT